MLSVPLTRLKDPWWSCFWDPHGLLILCTFSKGSYSHTCLDRYLGKRYAPGPHPSIYLCILLRTMYLFYAFTTYCYCLLIKYFIRYGVYSLCINVFYIFITGIVCIVYLYLFLAHFHFTRYRWSFYLMCFRSWILMFLWRTLWFMSVKSSIQIKFSCLHI